ncbi:lysostaphin resistance A-like protein [Enterococcus sp. AZ048]|uniref:CPBP family intramembrane glutamic endopeptidase n=1 Tax=Enterococcus sp. AZ048 TaxID=2774658 RepID=UPI003F68BDCC
MGKSSDLYLVEQILDLSISEETMMTSIKNGLAPVSLTIIYGVFFYYSHSFLWRNGWLIRSNDVSSQNVGFKLLTDFIISLLFVVVILAFMFFTKRPFSDVGLTTNSRWLSLSLLFGYIAMFLFHGDFTVKGIYLAFFYLVVVAFSEEFISRGFLFTKIDKDYNFETAIIISGLFFGAMHGILPTIVANGSLADLFINISGKLLGQGIIGGGLFALAYKKSGTLFVPVLIHALLDYSDIVFG